MTHPGCTYWRGRWNVLLEAGLTDIYYGGSESQWEQIDMEKSYNNTLLNANIHYNSTVN